MKQNLNDFKKKILDEVEETKEAICLLLKNVEASSKGFDTFLKKLRKKWKFIGFASLHSTKGTHWVAYLNGSTSVLIDIYQTIYLQVLSSKEKEKVFFSDNKTWKKTVTVVFIL